MIVAAGAEYYPSVGGSPVATAPQPPVLDVLFALGTFSAPGGSVFPAPAAPIGEAEAEAAKARPDDPEDPT